MKRLIIFLLCLMLISASTVALSDTEKNEIANQQSKSLTKKNTADAQTDEKDVIIIGGGKYIFNETETGLIFIGPENDNIKNLIIRGGLFCNGNFYSIVEIQEEACQGLKKLTSVTIDKTVKRIGKEAFKDCKALKKITVECTKLGSIGEEAFKNINKKATFIIVTEKQKVFEKYKKMLLAAGAPKKAKFKSRTYIIV